MIPHGEPEPRATRLMVKQKVGGSCHSGNSQVHLRVWGASPHDRVAYERKRIPGPLPSAFLPPACSPLGSSLSAFSASYALSPRPFPGMIYGPAPVSLVLNSLRKVLNPSLISPKATLTQPGHISSSCACWGQYSVGGSELGSGSKLQPWG